MHAQNLIINESSNGQAVEGILELFPDANGVAALALVVEAIHAVNLAGLMIASQEEKVLLELNLVGHEQDYGLKRVLSSVHVVAKEKIVRLWWEPAILEES